MRNSKKPLNVLMFGTLDSGKTSVLTQMLCEKNLQDLSLRNGLSLEIESEKESNFIKSSETILANFFAPEIPIPNSENTEIRDVYSKFPIYTYPTQDTYSITLSIKNSAGKKTLQNIKFTDCSGKLYRFEGIQVDKNSKKKCSEALNMVKDADVILFTVNSIDLMSDKSYDHDAALMFLDTLKQCYKSNPHTEKMIIFVPVKFEKYYKLNKDSFEYNYGQGSEYTKFMSRFYARHSSLIDWLKNPNISSQFDVSVLPVLTLGNIEFAEYAENYIGDVNPYEKLYQYNEIVDNKTIGTDIPKYMPQFCEYPMDVILAYLSDKILSNKIKRLSKLAFTDKFLQNLKQNLIYDVANTPKTYPYTVIQSKFLTNRINTDEQESVSPSDSDTTI